MTKKKDTSWGKVAKWYDESVLRDPDSYHRQVILPNLLRLMEVQPGEKILDLACGTGFFSREFSERGARVVGIDISPELIEIAKQNSKGHTDFHVSSADNLISVENKSIDKISLVLAIQNIDPVKKTLSECARVLKSKGKLFIVMNHPIFRIPKNSSWGFDVKTGKQYRRIDKYLSESKEIINMNPGLDKKTQTISFHRPLQYYFKLFNTAGFAVSKLEEWISHKKSDKGPRQHEEDRMRKEIPLFMFVELVKK